MGILSKIPVIGEIAGKVIDKVAPDKTESRAQQVEMNKVELESAPSSYLRLWRSFLGWALSLCLVWEVMVRPVVLTYWPSVVLPPSMLGEIKSLILGMLGLGF